MTEATILELGNNALMVTLMLGTPLLLVALAMGLVVSVFQATTQIHEMTLTFVPKMAAVFVTLVLAGPWMLSTLLGFTTNLYTNLPLFGR